MRQKQRGPGARERENMMRNVCLLMVCASLPLLVTCSDKAPACCCKYCKGDEVACGDVCQSKSMDCAWPENAGCACEQGSARRPCTVDSSTSDLALCRQPDNITSCDPPGKGLSDKYYYCWGCTGSCAGGATVVAACNTQHGDCRYFANSCIPKTYRMCTPENVINDQMLAGLCGYCFLRDVGVGHETGPGYCNKLVEAGVAPKDLGGKRQ